MRELLNKKPSTRITKMIRANTNRRSKNLWDNIASTYVLIFKDYCTKDLQQRIEQHPEFEEKIWDDPVAVSYTHLTLPTIA